MTHSRSQRLFVVVLASHGTSQSEKCHESRQAARAFPAATLGCTSDAWHIRNPQYCDPGSHRRHDFDLTGIATTPWQATPSGDDGSCQSIAAMPEYVGMSHEELRWRDYQVATCLSHTHGMMRSCSLASTPYVCKCLSASCLRFDSYTAHGMLQQMALAASQKCSPTPGLHARCYRLGCPCFGFFLGQHGTSIHPQACTDTLAFCLWCSHVGAHFTGIGYTSVSCLLLRLSLKQW